MKNFIILSIFAIASVNASDRPGTHASILAKEVAVNQKINQQEKYYNDYVRSLKYRASMRNRLGIERTGASTFKTYIYFV